MGELVMAMFTANAYGPGEEQSMGEWVMAMFNASGIPSIAFSVVIACTISSLFHSYLYAHLHLLSLFSISLFFTLPRDRLQTLYAACMLIFILSTQYALVSAPTNATDEVKHLLASQVVFASTWIFMLKMIFVPLACFAGVVIVYSTYYSVILIVLLFGAILFLLQVQARSTANRMQPPTIFSRLRDALLSKWCKVFSPYFFPTTATYTFERATALHMDPGKAVIGAFADTFFTFLVAYMATFEYSPFPSSMDEAHRAENILLYGIAAGTGLATTYHFLLRLCYVRLMGDVKCSAYAFMNACVGFLSDVSVHVLVGIFVCSDVIEGVECKHTVYRGITLVVLERCLSWLVTRRWVVFGRAVIVGCLVYLCVKRYGEIVGKG